jgi:hypothetical protein
LGIQLGSHSVFDEGADHVLDILQETAGINAVFAYATTYQGFARGRDIEALAPDHGVERRNPRDRDLTEVWFEPHDAYYAGTFLRHARRRDKEYGDRDVLAELVEPCRERGMKLYARMLEGFSRDLPNLIPNWIKVLSVDIYGRRTHLPCWNNPDYRTWWLSTIADLFKSYPLDGLKFGAERSGPLTNLLWGAYHGGVVPTCFCEHCREQGRQRGVDAENAREGYRQLYEFIRGLQAGEAAPPDGIILTLLRTIMRYPEVLAWEQMWYDSKESLKAEMYGAVKLLQPEARVGWHLYHNGINWLVLPRALMDYAGMVPYSDWIKPVVYHDIAGPRIHRDVGQIHNRVLQELSERQILHLLYSVLGWDAEVEPDWDELAHRGLSPDFVYRETRRCVEGVNDEIPVYPGLGFDIPWHGEHFYSDPETVYAATMKAYEAGAGGLIVSREYDEMRLDNLRAVGRATRDALEAGL